MASSGFSTGSLPVAFYCPPDAAKLMVPRLTVHGAQANSGLKSSATCGAVYRRLTCAGMLRCRESARGRRGIDAFLRIHHWSLDVRENHLAPTLPAPASRLAAASATRLVYRAFGRKRFRGEKSCPQVVERYLGWW